MMNGILLVYQTGPNQVFRTLLASLRFSHGYPFWWEVTSRTGMGWSLLGCKMIQDVFGKHFEVTNWKLPVFQDHLLGLVVGHTYFFFEELVELAVFIGEASEHVFPRSGRVSADVNLPGLSPFPDAKNTEDGRGTRLPASYKLTLNL